MGLPMTALAHMYLVDMVVHGWDLARATGQEYEPGGCPSGGPEDLSRWLAPCLGLELSAWSYTTRGDITR